MQSITNGNLPVPAEFQGKIWGLRAVNWSEQEQMSEPLFESILSEITTDGSSQSLLDVGCGSGVLCKMAYERGFNIAGIDASENMIKEAEKRLGFNFFYLSDMVQLPFNDNSFDIVTGITSFHLANNAEKALSEVHRVLKKDGQFFYAVWGRPDMCEANIILSSLKDLMPPPVQITERSVPPPSGLYENGKLESYIESFGFRSVKRNEVPLVWNYINDSELIRLFLSAGLITLAEEYSGADKVKEAALNAAGKLRNKDGSYSIKNVFVYSKAIKI